MLFCCLVLLFCFVLLFFPRFWFDALLSLLHMLPPVPLKLLCRPPQRPQHNTPSAPPPGHPVHVQLSELAVRSVWEARDGNSARLGHWDGATHEPRGPAAKRHLAQGAVGFSDPCLPCHEQGVYMRTCVVCAVLFRESDGVERQSSLLNRAPPSPLSSIICH